MSSPRPAQRKKARHELPPMLANMARRRFEDSKTSIHYQNYKNWCERMGVPAAEFAVWRMTSKRIRDV